MDQLLGEAVSEGNVVWFKQKLKEKGYSDKEIQEMLSDAGLAGINADDYGEDKALGWLWLLITLAIGAGLFWFLIFRRKRRDQTS